MESESHYHPTIHFRPQRVNAAHQPGSQVTETGRERPQARWAASNPRTPAPRSLIKPHQPHPCAPRYSQYRPGVAENPDQRRHSANVHGDPDETAAALATLLARIAGVREDASPPRASLSVLLILKLPTQSRVPSST